MMSRLGGDSRMSVDVTSSPSTSLQFVDNSSPIGSSLQTFYSKFLSSSSRTEHRSTVLTPDSKTNMTRLVSPFLQKRGAFNPFNQNLRERLEKPVFSPNVFSTVISPSQDSNEFKWTIEDMSKINPAPIEEEFHFEEQVDEQTETEIQNTIDKYFTKTHMIPSPWNCKLPTSWNSFTDVFKKEKQNILLNEHNNPTVCSSPYPYSMSRLDFVSRTPCQNVSTQTVLSLPPDLPENISSMLKPYFSDTSFEDMNSSMNNSLRRKLFFQKEDNSLSPASLFRVQEDSPLINRYCRSAIKSRTDGSPFEHFSPLDVSPIPFVDKKSVCNNFASPVHMTVQDHDDGKENIDPAVQRTNQLYEECYKVFESPKLSTGVRRKRKRRRSLSHDMDMDMSVSYSHFSAKHNSTEQTVPKFSVHQEESKMCIDTFSDNAVDSEDTGYCTASFDKITTKNDSNLKLTFNSWMNKFKDKNNTVSASTPAKE